MVQHLCSYVVVLSCGLTLFFGVPAAGQLIAPTIDPFGPPPMPTYMPPPPNQQNYINPPPDYNNPPPNYNNPPPNFNYNPPPNFNYNPPPNYNNYMPPLNNAIPPGGLSQFQFSQMGGGPPLPPIGPTPDISQPMPPSAAAAGSGSGYGSGPTVVEQEYEAGEPGRGGVGSAQPYAPPPSFPVQPSHAYYPQSTSLLDAYYGRGGGGHTNMAYQQHQQQQRRNNDIFGGMFGGTPGGNLMGALMFNEFVF